MIGPRPARRLEAWLADAGCRWERLRYPRPEAGGEVSACRFVPAGAPRGRVVLAHGAGNDALYPLLALAKPLVRRGFELFCFDLDGHGRESTTSFDLDAVERALAAAAARAEADGPGLPLHLLGHSLGGSLVLHALSTGALDGVASAAVVSSPLQVSLDLRTAIGELRSFFRLDTLSQREHYGLWGLVPAVGWLKRGAFPLRIVAGAAAEAVGAPPGGRARRRGALSYVETVAALLARLELERAARAIRVPVLLAYGAADRLVPPEQGERLARAIPRSELLRVEGGSHWSTVFAPAVVERVCGWVEAHTPARVAA